MRELDRVGRPDWLAVDRVLARTAGVPGDKIDLTFGLVEEIYVRLPWVPVPDAAEVLRALQLAGFALAVVSNASGTMERQLAEHRICSVDGDISAQVAVVVDSDVVGVEKPDPRIFEIALRALGMAAERCLYVGDTVHFDVEGARAVGMQAVHFDPFRLCPEDDHPHIGSLHELVGNVTAT
jgi:putative hydrolase of the HAD superfamily